MRRKKTSWRKWLPGLLLLAALPAPAPAQTLCASIDRILRSAGEPIPFASLDPAAAAGEVLVAGFRPMSCRVAAGESISCWRNLAPDTLSVAAMAPALHDCLGLPGPPPDPEGPARETFLASGLRFEIGHNCTPRCRAGLIAWLRVTLAGRR
jgi:hypothetical protein